MNDSEANHLFLIWLSLLPTSTEVGMAIEGRIVHFVKFEGKHHRKG